MAELFATNGVDADSTLILGRSDLQDSLCRVELYTDGEPEGEFQGYLRRPDGLVSGVVVKFFAEDGPLADGITAMGHSGVLDQAFEVRVFQLQTAEGAEVKPSPRRKGDKTPAETLWVCGLWGDPKAWPRLGTQESFEAWLQDHPETLSKGVYAQRRGWGWERLKDQMRVASMRDASAREITDHIARIGLLEKLPAEIRDAAQAERMQGAES